ncbi:MAG: ASKHA domain-containing protein [Deltaproteobacteria bacterium]|jgi:uncharacterized 2Fe-2S/4Fe-4S cluster protein (DUF4445 family)|nr:ASKHA domain-containing protein [Deltaproteobacteria bacterium]
MSEDAQQYDIIFLPDQVTIKAAVGETILDIANRGNIHINASCGGEGVCGRCMVELKEGTVEAAPGLYLSEEDYESNLRLACRAKCNGNATIFIPLESRGDASVFRKAVAADEAVSVETLDPTVSQVELTLEPPSQMDNVADLDRVNNALAGEGLTDLSLDLKTIIDMPAALREGDFKVRATIHQELPLINRDGPKVPRILNFTPAKGDDNFYGLAVDVGTTSVWVRIVNLKTGEVFPSTGDLNGQISYGEDVISRIVYADRKDGTGLGTLQRQVVDTINRLLSRLEETSPGYRKQTYLMYVSGNTTMSHLLAAVPPKNIRLAPYVPPVASWPMLRASDLGIEVEPYTLMQIFPSVSSYVGGDIVSGVLASGFYEREEMTLFIDVGTNGEIVIGNKDWMTCAACSAGPAFEGGGVKCGMRAAPGAIDDFYYDPEKKTHRLGVIGGGKPSGICGSGLINIVSELFKTGVISKQGKYMEGSAPFLRTAEDGVEYLLAPQEESAGGHDVVLTEIDIENLIRAKGAMFSGYQTLVEGVGLTMQDLEKVIIAGGFGRSLNIDNAITIGLLPKLPLERFQYIGNSSLTGATLATLSGSMWLKANDIKAMMTNFELSETPGYMDKYMASQFIPHTDAALFA